MRKPQTWLVKRLPDHTYRIERYLVVGPHDRFDRWLRRRFRITDQTSIFSEAQALSVANEERGHRVFIVWLSRFDWSIVAQGVLTHEVFHHTMSALGFVGLRYSHASREAYAYYTQTVYEQCLEALRHFNNPYAKRRRP